MSVLGIIILNYALGNIVSRNKPSYEMLEEKVKALESELELNKSFLNMLFDTIPNPIFYKDKDGVYQYGNETFSKTILGIHKDEIIGKTLYNIPDKIPKELADIYYQKDQELFDNPGVQNYEAEVKCADGMIHNYNFYKATFLSESQEALGIVGVMLDITSYKKVIQELATKNKILAEISIRDPLTQLYNRRSLEEYFQRKRSLLVHHEQPFALMLIDVDFFKAYNDTFGHPQGDKLLVILSNIMKKTFDRTIDFVFRLGGEEFAILYNFSERENALHLAKKLLIDIENLNIPAANTSVSNSLTISAGLALVSHVDNKKIELSYFYEEVDKLLYNSKTNGRNQLSYIEYK